MFLGLICIVIGATILMFVIRERQKGTNAGYYRAKGWASAVIFIAIGAYLVIEVFL